MSCFRPKIKSRDLVRSQVVMNHLLSTPAVSLESEGVNAKGIELAWARTMRPTAADQQSMYDRRGHYRSLEWRVNVGEEIRSAREQKLISECKAGRGEQFHALIEPYVESIKLVSYSILKNKPDVEEVTQESILKAFTHLNQLREGENFKAWLLQIAANEARMRLAKDRKHLYSSFEEEVGEKDFRPKQFANWRDIPSHELERKELHRVLTAALECLEEPYREVFVLRDVQHLSAAETGEILGISEGAVYTRLHRARLQMREHLTPFFRSPRPVSMTRS